MRTLRTSSRPSTSTNPNTPSTTTPPPSPRAAQTTTQILSSPPTTRQAEVIHAKEILKSLPAELRAHIFRFIIHNPLLHPRIFMALAITSRGELLGLPFRLNFTEVARMASIFENKEDKYYWCFACLLCRRYKDALNEVLSISDSPFTEQELQSLYQTAQVDARGLASMLSRFSLVDTQIYCYLLAVYERQHSAIKVLEVCVNILKSKPYKLSKVASVLGDIGSAGHCLDTVFELLGQLSQCRTEKIEGVRLYSDEYTSVRNAACQSYYKIASENIKVDEALNAIAQFAGDKSTVSRQAHNALSQLVEAGFRGHTLISTLFLFASYADEHKEITFKSLAKLATEEPYQEEILKGAIEILDKASYSPREGIVKVLASLALAGYQVAIITSTLARILQSPVSKMVSIQSVDFLATIAAQGHFVDEITDILIELTTKITDQLYLGTVVKALQKIALAGFHQEEILNLVQDIHRLNPTLFKSSYIEFLQALGERGLFTSKVLGELTKFMTDSNGTLRNKMLIALARIADSGNLNKDLSDILVQLAADPTPWVRQSLAYNLKSFSVEESLKRPLVNAILDFTTIKKSYDSQKLKIFIRNNLCKNEAFTETLVDYYWDLTTTGEPSTRGYAAIYLGIIAREGHFQDRIFCHIVNLVRDKNSELRYNSLLALSKLDHLEIYAEEIVDALHYIVIEDPLPNYSAESKRENYNIIGHVVFILERIHVTNESARKALTILKSALNYEGITTVDRALANLATQCYLHEEIMEVFKEVPAISSTNRFRTTALPKIANSDYDINEVASQIIATIESTESTTDVRKYRIPELKSILLSDYEDKEKVLELINTLASEEDKHILTTTSRLLRNITEEGHYIDFSLPLLIQLSKHPSKSVYENAVVALGEIGAAGYHVDAIMGHLWEVKDYPKFQGITRFTKNPVLEAIRAIIG